MSLKIYVPGDAAALSVGAEGVAKAMAEQQAAQKKPKPTAPSAQQ